jgi:hypothetical protein
MIKCFSKFDLEKMDIWQEQVAISSPSRLLASQSISQSAWTNMSESLLTSFYPPNTPTSDQPCRKQDRVRYKIEFPPGPMGLELEPVIRSVDRELGCRVKEFYFGTDHHQRGIDPAFILARVQIGHIISSINGVDIKSWTFSKILEKLRSLKDETRIISFRNISATCMKLFLPFIWLFDK